MLIQDYMGLSDDAVVLIIIVIVFVVANTFSYYFLGKINFDFVVIYTGIFLLYLVYWGVIDEYYSAFALLILGTYFYYLYNQSRKDY